MIGTIWKHKKGDLYKVLQIANEASQDEDKPTTVVYERCKDKTVWSRPLQSWKDSFTIFSSIAEYPDKPKWLTADRIIFESFAGSRLYGTNNENSDIDIVAVCIPPMEMLLKPDFIHGFDEEKPFNQYQKINHEIDIKVYNVTRFAKLAAQGNPNILELLFACDSDAPYFVSDLFKRLMNIREEFLSQQIFKTFIGYSVSQANKAYASSQNENFKAGSKRRELVDKHGYDTKFGHHCIRLLLYGIDLITDKKIHFEKHVDTLRSIKKGEVQINNLMGMSEDLLSDFDKLRDKSELPKFANLVKIRESLRDIIFSFRPTKQFIGSLPVISPEALKRIRGVLNA